MSTSFLYFPEWIEMSTQLSEEGYKHMFVIHILVIILILMDSNWNNHHFTEVVALATLPSSDAAVIDVTSPPSGVYDRMPPHSRDATH